MLQDLLIRAAGAFQRNLASGVAWAPRVSGQ